MFSVNGTEFRNFELNHSLQQPINMVYYQTRDGALRRLLKPGFKHNFAISIRLLTRADAESLVGILNTTPDGLTIILPNGKTYTCSYTGESIALPDHNKEWVLDLTFEGVENA